MTKLSSIISEMSALDAATEKNASKSSSRLASFLDKIAEEAEKEDDTEKCQDCGKNKEDCTCGAKKEGSMNNDTAMKIARAYKQAVLDNEQTQGSTVQVGAKANDGAATNAARDTDQIIPLDSVESRANSNPQKHNTSTSSDLIEGITPNSADMAEPLQEGKMAEAFKTGALKVIESNEYDMLTKFAGLGYNYLVEAYSDQLVQEKVANAIMAKKAEEAPEKIASALLNQQSCEKTASANQYNNALQQAYAYGYNQAVKQAQMNNVPSKDEATVQKLAAIKRNDPQLFDALHTLAKRNLI